MSNHKGVKWEFGKLLTVETAPMNTLRLERFIHSLAGVIGRIRLGDFWIFTLEPRWLSNQPNRSCIPLGNYEIKRHIRPSGQPSILLLDVPRRTEILFHPGNTLRDTQGCILPGMDYEVTSEIARVFSSAEAMDDLLGVVHRPGRWFLDVVMYNPYLQPALA